MKSRQAQKVMTTQWNLKFLSEQKTVQVERRYYICTYLLQTIPKKVPFVY